MTLLSSGELKQMIDDMSLDEKIGQISQIDINILFDMDNSTGEAVLNHSRVEDYIGRIGVGSIFNNMIDNSQARGSHTAREQREVYAKIQSYSKKHPILFGMDSIHGANYMYGATLFPQPLNMAATFSPPDVEKVGEITSRDTRAAGVAWLFAPLLGLGVDGRWSRLYETFGEDPLVVETLARGMIRGIQQDSKDGGIPSLAAACGKHFIGYSMPNGGHDRAPSWIPRRHLYEYFVRPWKNILLSEDKPWTIMEDYTEIDGVPTVANHELLSYLLRFRLNYTQHVVVTDYAESDNLVDWHHTAKTIPDALQQVWSDADGIDTSMIPLELKEFHTTMKRLISSDGVIKEERLNKSVYRILHLKYNLLNLTTTLPIDDFNIDKVGTDRDFALQIAQQSIVLVKNNNNTALPLTISKNKIKILITGPTSNSLAYQSGGWTWRWQGVPVEDAYANNNENHKWFSYGTTLYQAARNNGNNNHVSYKCGVTILGENCNDDDDATSENSSIEDAVEEAKESDVILIGIGEENYAEKPGDLPNDDMSLPEGQIRLVRALAAEKKTIILVYFGGRPRLLSSVEPYVDAILIAFLPGPDGGQAVYDIITGKINPSANLPITYPKYNNNYGGGIPYYHAISQQCTTAHNNTTGTTNSPLPHYTYQSPCQVQWPFGYGLSYTTFQYTNLQISHNQLLYHPPPYPEAEESKTPTVTVTVTNTGTRGGYNTVLFFVFDQYRKGVTPPYKLLYNFTRTPYLQPGQSQTISVPIHNRNDFFLTVGPNDDSHYVYVQRQFRIGLGAESDCRRSPSDKLCTDPIIFQAVSDFYNEVCDIACQIWTTTTTCNNPFFNNKKSCWQTCRQDYKNNQGWNWDYVSCLENVIQKEIKNEEEDCWKLTSFCRDIFSSNNQQHSLSRTSNNNTTFFLFLSGGGFFTTTILLLLVFWKKRQRQQKTIDLEMIPVITATMDVVYDKKETSAMVLS